MKFKDLILSFFCMEKPKEVEDKEEEYTYTYYAQTPMGNWSRRGTFTFTPTEEELEKYGSPEKAGFSRFYHKMSSPFPLNGLGHHKFKCGRIK